MNDQLDHKEQIHYDHCAALYRELDGVELNKHLLEQKDKLVGKLSKASDEQQVWKCVGQLELIQELTTLKSDMFNKIMMYEGRTDAS